MTWYGNFPRHGIPGIKMCRKSCRNPGYGNFPGRGNFLGFGNYPGYRNYPVYGSLTPYTTVSYNHQ